MSFGGKHGWHSVSLAVFHGTSLCPALEGLAVGTWVQDAVCSTGSPAQTVGMGQSQNKGPVVPAEKTQTCVSLRLKLPVPRRLVPIKGTLCGSQRGEEAPRLSLGTGLTALEPQLTVLITLVTLDLLDRADTRPDGQTVMFGTSLLCVCLGASIV